MIKGQKMTEEQKKKISQAHKGMKKPWSGKYMTESHKEAISKRMLGNKLCLGRQLSAETVEKLRKSNIGKKHNISPEGRARMKIKNYDVWNKGLSMKGETKRKLSVLKIGKEASWMIGNNYCLGDKNAHYGKFGKYHPSWKEEKRNVFTKIIRNIRQYVKWRSDIFKRDNYTCVLCGATGVYIEADHYPKRFSEILVENGIKTVADALKCAELWDTLNGRTLCKKCHDPTRGRYKKSLEEQ